MKEWRPVAEFYRRSKPAIGAAIVGVSVWCAAGTVAVISSDSSSSRLVALAPWWVFGVAFGLAWLVRGWRAHPMTTTPALLATLPWWPIPLPAVALVWTGALAWVPIGAALMVAEGGRAITWVGRVVGAHEAVRATRLAAIGSLVIGLLAAWAVNPRVPGGDEPHYLVITQSLLKDQDLRIENNHVARDYADYFGGTINPDYLVRGRDGAIYSIHAPGVSMLLLPGFAAFGFRGAQATLLLMFAITGALVWRSAWRLTADTSAAWFAWAAVAGSTTLAVLSFMVFPDAPGACAVAAGVWLMVAHREASARAIVAVSALLAALPWLHSRFGVLAGALGIAIVVMFVLDRSRATAARWRRIALFSVIPALSAAAWLSMFYLIYGSFDPRVPYGPDPEIRPWIWAAVAGLFVDQQFGLMTYAPVLAAAALAVLFRAPREWRLVSAVHIVIVLVYAMAVASYWMWWAGVPGLPSRFMTAGVPLLTVPLAVVWSRSSAVGRSALLALLTVSLSITALVLAVDRGAMAWNPRNGQAAWLEWLNPLVNLPRAWPSFFWNGEAAFLRHAAVLIGVVAVSTVLLYVGRGSRRATAATWLLIGTMVAAQVGWTMTESERLDPARAQLAVHAAAGRGATVWQIGGGLRRWNATAAPIQIPGDQPPLVDRPSPAVLVLGDVPAGAYRLEITPLSTASGELKVSIGRSPTPLYRVAVTASPPTMLPIALPAGAAVLLVEAATADLAKAVRVTLTPTSTAGPGPGRARAYARYGTSDVFLLDANVFPEGDGFWVRGGQTAEVVISRADSASRSYVLQLRNGGAANTVTVKSGAWQEVLSLAAGEERAVTVPAADPLGTWLLSITSSSGFRPSDTAGTDARFLGVWVSLNR